MIKKLFKSKNIFLITIIGFLLLFITILSFTTAGGWGDQEAVLSYHFDKDSSVGENDAFVYDWSDNNNHGTVYGATWTPSGKFGGAFEFDGDGDYIDATDSMALRFGTSDFTLSAWIKAKSGSTGTQYIFNKYANKDRYRFYLTSSGYLTISLRGCCPETGFFQHAYRQDLRDDAWHHIVFTADRDVNGTLYLDGTNVGAWDVSALDGYVISGAGRTLKIGSNAAGTNWYFNGTIDEVMIFNRNLNESEVLELYNSQGNLNCIDADNDGYYAYDAINCLIGNDCNDTNLDIHPGATEICGNGIDEDCNGVDMLNDLDNDTYVAIACGGNDCDDINPDIHPGATETCNNIDDNCDNIIDEGFDNDLDSFTTCDLPIPDCDDFNSSVYPGAPEICEDGIDQDCDGEDLLCASVCVWKDCKKGAASFSIDDANSGCRSELESAGFRGTYYLNGNNFPLFWKDYANAGHEVSSHTVRHPCTSPCNYPDIYNCSYTQNEVDVYRVDELEPNIFAIESVTEKPVLSLAWPCGCTDIIRETAASYYYVGARGAPGGCNFSWIRDTENSDPEDFYNLHASGYDQILIDKAINQGKWAMVISHGDCSSIDYMGSKENDLYLAPIGEILKYIMIRNATEFTNWSRTNHRINFTAFHTLPEFIRNGINYPFLNITFNDEVTLKVLLNSDDEVFYVKVGGVEVPFINKTIDGEWVVLFNTALDSPKNIEILMKSGLNCIDADNDSYYAYDAINCLIGNDCNDTNLDIHPGATEICGNGIDEDCNGFDTACVEYTTDLSEGWNVLWLLPKHVFENLHSLNGNYTVENVLESLNNNYEIVYYHDGISWLSYVPGESQNTLEVMNNENNYPYRIKMTSNETLEI